MDTHDWRAQLLPHIREIKVNEIMNKLKLYQSHGGDDDDDDKLLEVQKIAQSFEQKTYAGAASQEDYLQKISSTMQLITDKYWRALLQPDSCQRIVNKLMEVLIIHLPFTGQEGLDEIHKIALRFEEEIYGSATNQSDYLRRISLKMLAMATRGQNAIANPMSYNFGDNTNGPSHTDWRAQLQPNSCQRIIDTIMETLIRHLPFRGQEGLNELRKIALRFEEKMYGSATSQTDYLGKIYLKILTMETRVQNTVANPMPSNFGDNTSGPSHTGSNYWGLTLGGEQVMAASGWRSELQPHDRKIAVEQIMHAVKLYKNLDEDGMLELEKFSQSFEKKTFAGATSQLDYLQQIALKKVSMNTSVLGKMQEEARQKIVMMKEMYLPDLIEIYQKVVGKIQQVAESVTNQKLKAFRDVLERFVAFLQLSSLSFPPAMSQKIASYEKSIMKIINAYRLKVSPSPNNNNHHTSSGT